jgi:pyruvate/2-oxoglutarate dehydrogenase complex dihydrolipoamide dehydrogenase (E3) component
MASGPREADEMTREFEPDVEPFDLIVIGSGPAGEKAAAKAAYVGKRVALIERSQRSVGGVAVTSLGMVPTKTLRESALYLTGFRKREIYGVSVQLEPSAIHFQLGQRSDDVSATMRPGLALVVLPLCEKGARTRQGRAAFTTSRRRGRASVSSWRAMRCRMMPSQQAIRARPAA